VIGHSSSFLHHITTQPTQIPALELAELYESKEEEEEEEEEERLVRGGNCRLAATNECTKIMEIPKDV
jgi:hypothetical protein